MKERDPKSVLAVEVKNLELLLLPCPFCGSDGARLFEEFCAPELSDWFVECPKCSAALGYIPTKVEGGFDSPAKVAKAWNTRAEVRRRVT